VRFFKLPFFEEERNVGKTEVIIKQHKGIGKERLNNVMICKPEGFWFTGGNGKKTHLNL
jgi:hypothetical protein